MPKNMRLNFYHVSVKAVRHYWLCVDIWPAVFCGLWHLSFLYRQLQLVFCCLLEILVREADIWPITCNGIFISCLSWFTLLMSLEDASKSCSSWSLSVFSSPPLCVPCPLLFSVCLVSWGHMLAWVLKGLWQVCEEKIVPKPLTKNSP